MSKKKLIPRPKPKPTKFITSWGYSFQNGGEIPSFKKGGSLSNDVMSYQSGNVLKTYSEPYKYSEDETLPDGTKVRRNFTYKNASVDQVNKPNVYVRGRSEQSMETINKNKAEMSAVRSRFPNVKTQQEVVELLKNKQIKPYEAQLLVQAIANERSEYLGKSGKFYSEKTGSLTNEYQDEDSGFTFKIDESGNITTKRNLLNEFLRNKAMQGDRNYKGWQNLNKDLDYTTGVIDLEKESIKYTDKGRPSHNQIHISYPTIAANGYIARSDIHLQLDIDENQNYRLYVPRPQDLRGPVHNLNYMNSYNDKNDVDNNVPPVPFEIWWQGNGKELEFIRSNVEKTKNFKTLLAKLIEDNRKANEEERKINKKQVK